MASGSSLGFARNDRIEAIIYIRTTTDFLNRVSKVEGAGHGITGADQACISTSKLKPSTECCSEMDSLLGVDGVVESARVHAPSGSRNSTGA